jgi:very-short-patch-repair endonuclease
MAKDDALTETNREAAKAAPAIKQGRHRGGGWHTVTRGVRRQLAVADAFRADLWGWQTTFRPVAAFTHLTSVRVRGWWLPPMPDWMPVFVGMSAAHNAPKRPGLDITRRVVGPEYELIDGLRIATPTETVIAAADDLGALDLAILIVSAIRAGDTSLAELQPISRQHFRGSPRMREALQYVDPLYESAMEVLLGSLHRVCGIEVIPQHEVFDDAGAFVARADLLLAGTRTLHEYDGAHHLDREQQGHDLRRLRRLEDAGYPRRGYNADDVLHHPETIIRDADRTLGRPHRPGRVAAWWALLNESLHTPAGRRRLRKRLKISPEI